MLIYFTLILLCFLSPYVTAEIFDGHTDRGSTVVFSLAEEQPPGTLIESLIEKLGPKPASSSQVLFTPLGQERYIRLNQTSGQLFVRTRIDREALCEQVGTCCTSSSKPQNPFPHAFENDDANPDCALRLLVIDQRDPGSSAQPKLVHIIFNIVDINDNPPKWSPDTLEIEIPEHSPIGTTVQLPEATDPDQCIESAPIRYELIPQIESTNVFSSHESRNIADMFLLSITPIDSPFGALQKLNLQLKVNGDLDRERRDQYRLLLIATDGGSKNPVFGDRTGTLNIIIKVTDINDQAPYFPDEHPSVEVSEDVEPRTRIFTMTAKDDDPSDATRLIYRFASTASGEVMRLFSICEKTGTITLSHELDYETAPLLPDSRLSNSIYSSQGSKAKEVGYIIPVRVTDGVHFSQAELRVRLKNVNDNAPNITVQSHLPRWRNTNDLLLPEDVAVGTMIATITMEDADERWMDDKYGSGRGYSESQCETAHPFFAVQPLFPSARYQYMLVTSRLLDRETKNAHTVTIACHDSGQPVLSRGVHVVIHLEDLNDSPPSFTQGLYQSKILENLPFNTLIDKVQAIDSDIGINAAIRYGIQSDVDLGDLIKLDPVSGQIYSAAAFDREKMESINFTVIATDCAVGAVNQSENHESCSVIHTASASVIIMIEDVNDCVPEFDRNNYEFVVKEGQRPQQSIGSVHATDNDADAKNSRIQYSISESEESQQLTHPGASGNDGDRVSSLFAITSTGEIYTRNLPIDREKTPILSFTVVASDFGHPSLSAFANVVIRVQDVNDHSPVWIFPQSSNNIIVRVNMSSHATVGQEIAHLKAIDADSGLNGEIEYTIIKGNEHEFFALDRASGTLYLAKQLFNNPKPPSADQNETTPINMQNQNESTPQAFILALKASDKGITPRSNTTILKIDVIQNQRGDRSNSLNNPNKGRHTGSPIGGGFGMIGDRDLIIITAMIVIALIISFVLIAAIVLLRCRQPRASRDNGMHVMNSAGGGRGRMTRRLEVLNCLGRAEETFDNKNIQTNAFIVTDAERNPNFEEHIHSPPYDSNNATPVHGAFQMLPRDGDVYGGFPQTVILASSTIPSARKVPIIATSGDGVPIGYMVTSNPATLDSKFMNYETITLKQNFHPHQSHHQQSQQQPMCTDDTSSSSTDNPKNAYSSLLYRIPDDSSITVEKNYMTINPELFQQSIYHRLQVPGEGNEVNTQEREGVSKKVVVLAHENSPVRGRATEQKKPSKDAKKIEKHCRFSTTQEIAGETLFSQPNNFQKSSSK